MLPLKESLQMQRDSVYLLGTSTQNKPTVELNMYTQQTNAYAFRKYAILVNWNDAQSRSAESSE